MNAVKGISETFNIFRSSRHKMLNGGQWIKNKKHITDSDIYKHLTGYHVIAYCLKYYTDIFGIDIDLHGNYLNDQIKEQERMFKYNLVCDKLGYPSLLFRSSDTGGLHCYWRLNEKILHRVIHSTLLDLFGNDLKYFEVLPTPSKPLALPYAKKRKGTILDPVTLKPLLQNETHDLKQVVDNIINSEIRHPTEVFQRSLKIDNIFIKNVSIQERVKNYNRVVRLEKHLKQIIPLFKQGNTNDAIEKAAFNCYINKYTVEQAATHITGLLLENNVELKADTKERSILSRVKAHYNRYKEQKIKPSMKVRHNDLDFIEQSTLDYNISHVLEVNNITHKSTIKAITRFTKHLFIWNRYITGLNEYDRNVLNYYYAYFYVNTKFKKLVPIPRTIMETWSNRNSYQSMMQLLLSANIIQLEKDYINPVHLKVINPYIKGICRYYSVNFRPLLKK
jgi:hypothetical protein